MKEYKHFLGIDIAKNKMDMVWHDAPSRSEEVKNSKEAITAFCAAHKERLKETLVVLEATGGYETEALFFLVKQGVAVHRVSPLQSKNYRCSVQLRGKTDKGDAQILARYGAERHGELPLFVLPAPSIRRLQVLSMRRDDLVSMRMAEQKRAQHPQYEEIKNTYVEPLIKSLNEQITAIEAEMATLVKDSPDLKEKAKVLQSIAGIGVKTAQLLLAEMPELGTLTRREVASLAGVAPHPKDSGKHTGYRSTGGGRPRLRRGMFMAGMGARNAKKSEFAAFYQHLILKGKKPMVALVAVMRKLIVVANAKIRDLLMQQKTDATPPLPA
jgi:transposase